MHQFTDLNRLGVLGTALIVSAILHIVLIISLNFEFPDLNRITDKMPALDVVLVNTKTKSKPKKADALAQANLDRGGNTDENRHMKTALPPPKMNTSTFTVAQQNMVQSQAAKVAAKQSEEELQADRVAALEQKAQEIMTQLNAIKKVQLTPAATLSNKAPAEGQAQVENENRNAQDLMQSSLEIARLEAQIAKNQEEYEKRPKRKMVGARTQEYRFATYVEAWRQKVEKIGNRNYPQAAKDQKIYGQLRMTVAIKADGSVEKIIINQSSGHKILDNAAKNIVKLAAPYAPFPDSIRQDTDIIMITRTWTFTKEAALATQSE